MANRFLNNIRINDEYTLPAADGTADQIIVTDGAGNLSFVDTTTIAVGESEQVHIACKNTSGVAISKGDPVYITGTVGTSFRVEIAAADASNSAKMPAVGLAESDLAINAEGYVVVSGVLKNLTTDPLSTGDGTPSSNDTVYVKAGGGLTKTKPTGSGNLIQNVGKVGRVNSSNAGSIAVSTIMRTNDVPNLTTGKIWVGSSTYTTESTVVHLDESNGRMGIGTTNPQDKLHITGGNSFNGLRIEGTSPGVYLIDTQATSAHHISSNENALYFLKDTDQNGSYNTVLGYWAANNNFIFNTGNVGIGTSSPQEKLDISAGNIRLDDSRQITWATTDANVGRVRISGSEAADNIAFFTDNSERMRLTNTGLGIGTTSPGDKLHVAGNIYLGSSTQTVYTTSTANLHLQTGTGITKVLTGNGATTIAEFKNAGSLQLNQYGSGTFTGTATQRLGVDSSGNVIEIPIGSGAVDGSGTTNYVTKWTDADTIGNSIIYDNGTNVGIGTTSPQEQLHLYGGNLDTRELGTSNAANVIYLNTKNGPSGGGGTGIGTGLVWAPYYGGYTKRSAGIMQIAEGNYFRSALAFYTNNTTDASTDWSERMRISMDGNVGIGTASPSRQLHVSGDTFGAVLISGAANDAFSEYDDGTNVWKAGIDYSQSAYRITHTNFNGSGISLDSSGNLTVDGDAKVAGAYYDSNNSAGTSGQVLSSTATGTDWISLNDIYYTETEADSRFVNVTGDTMTGALTASGGINGLTLSNGISGSNFNITGVNQITINDPGEGILFGGGSNNVTLYAIDDSTDNKMNFGGASELQVNGSKVFHDGYHPNADIWTTARTITIGNTGKSVNGSANVSWSLSEIGAAASSHTHSEYLLNNADDTTSGSLTVGSTSSTSNKSLKVLAGDSYIASIEAMGGDQGTGKLYIGQASNYGGGIMYNGDDNPDLPQTVDAISFYRRTNNTEVEVFSYPYNSNVVTFTSDIVVSGGDITLGGTGRIQGVDTVSAGTDAANKTYVDNAVSGFVDGSGTTNYVAKFSDSDTITNSIIYDNGTNVGIGTSSPSDKLHIVGSNGSVRIDNSSSTKSFSFTVMDSNNRFRIYDNTASSERLTITNGGNVGIGTTSPSEKLEVAGNVILDSSNANIKIKAGVTGTKGDIQWTFNTDSTVYASAGITYDNRGTDGFLIDSGYPITLDFASSHLRFSNNGSEKMRINTSGYVGIGTTSPGSELEVDGEITTTTITYPEPGASDSSAYNGEIVYFGTELSMTEGKLMVLSTSAGGLTWYLAKDSTTSLATGMLGIALGTAASDGVLVRGIAKNSAWSSFSEGEKLYLSPTAGGISNSITQDTNDFVRIVGYALGGNKIYFCPDNTYVQNS